MLMTAVFRQHQPKGTHKMLNSAPQIQLFSILFLLFTTSLHGEAWAQYSDYSTTRVTPPAYPVVEQIYSIFCNIFHICEEIAKPILLFFAIISFIKYFLKRISLMELLRLIAVFAIASIVIFIITKHFQMKLCPPNYSGPNLYEIIKEFPWNALLHWLVSIRDGSCSIIPALV